MPSLRTSSRVVSIVLAVQALSACATFRTADPPGRTAPTPVRVSVAPRARSNTFATASSVLSDSASSALETNIGDGTVRRRRTAAGFSETSSATLSRIASRTMLTHAEAPAGAGTGAGGVVMGLLSLGRAVGGATQQVSNGIRDAVGDPQCPHRASRVGAVRSDAVHDDVTRSDFTEELDLAVPHDLHAACDHGIGDDVARPVADVRWAVSLVMAGHGVRHQFQLRKTHWA